MLVFLDLNGEWLVETTEDDLYDMATATAAHQWTSGVSDPDIEVAAIANWLRGRLRSTAFSERRMRFREFRLVSDRARLRVRSAQGQLHKYSPHSHGSTAPVNYPCVPVTQTKTSKSASEMFAGCAERLNSMSVTATTQRRSMTSTRTSMSSPTPTVRHWYASPISEHGSALGSLDGTLVNRHAAAIAASGAEPGSWHPPPRAGGLPWAAGRLGEHSWCRMFAKPATVARLVQDPIESIHVVHSPRSLRTQTR